MSILTKILGSLVALEFCYILYLETFAPTSIQTGRVFKMSQAVLNRPEVQTLFKNQGVYNGLLAVGLIYSLFFATANLEMTRGILIYIILVAAYGSLTSDRKILFTQGGLAILTLISSFF
jgi:Predicted membrane protein